MILFKNLLFTKELNALAIFRAIHKNKIRGLGRIFSIFFYENFPYIILYQFTKFKIQNQTFTSEDIKQFEFLNSCLVI